MSNFLKKFIKGGLLLSWLNKQDSNIWSLLETSALEFILESLSDEDGKVFLDLLEKDTDQAAFDLVEYKIPEFENRLTIYLQAKIAKVIEQS